MTDPESGHRSNIEVPAPRSTPSDGGETSINDAGDLSTRAIPLDAGGTIARWVRRHVVEVSIFLVLVGLLSVGALLAMRDPGPSSARDVVSVGPSPGQQIEPYVAVRKRALEDAAATGGERVGVMTFDRRLTSGEFDSLAIAPPLQLAGVIVGVGPRELEVIAPVPTVETAVDSWRERRQRRYEAQIAGADEQLAASPSPTPIADWYQGQKKSAQLALDRIRAGTVIEGALVSGSLKDLLAAQQNAQVLLVDIAPEGKRPDEVIPVLPGGAGG